MVGSPVSPARPEEAATTREEMDFDNSDHEQETGKVSPLGTDDVDKRPPSMKSPSPKPRVSFQEGPAEEIPPSKPPRPTYPHEKAEITLIEAFPSIDAKVVKAVLQASGGQVEPAFNALLGMSDPSFNAEEAPPARPPRPSAMKQTPPQSRAQQPLSQMESDELYARQLAEHYNTTGGRGGQYYNQREPGRRGPNQQRPRYDEEDREHSFFDDDLPEIGRNIQQGFMETQKKVNSWITNFKKKLDGEEEEDLYSGSASGAQGGRVGGMTGGSGTLGGRQNFGSSQSEQLYGIRKSAEQQRRADERRSMDAQRYDGDPQMIDDSEFQRLELKDDDQPPPQPPRNSSKAANPDLFKSSTARPPQSGPVDEVDAAERSTSSGDPRAQSKKWQSLTSVAPNPEEDNDPFSVGDDDDERDDKKEDLRKEDSERLKEQARQSVSGGGSGGKVLAESERSGSVGTKNKEAEDLLAGKKD